MELLGIPIVAVGSEERHVAGLGGNEQVFVGPEGIVGIKCHSGNSVFHADILAQTIRFANHACLRTELRGESVLCLFTAVAGYFSQKEKQHCNHTK
jgi:hypothetical protein